MPTASGSLRSKANAIIECKRRSGWEQAVKILDAAKQALEPDVVCVNAAISSCSAAQGDGRHRTNPDWRIALGLLSTALQWSLRPSAVSYKAVAVSISLQWRLVLCVYNLLETFAVEADATACTILLAAAARSRRWLLAAVSFTSWKSWRGVRPDSASYNAVLAGNTWRRALLHAGRMSADGIRTDSVTVGTCLRALEDGLCWPQASLLLCSAERGGAANFVCALSAISCLQGLQWKASLQVFERLSGHVGRVRVLIQNAVAAACSSGGQWPAACEVVRSGRNRLAPDLVSYGAILAGLDVAGLWNISMMFMQCMRHSAIEADHVADMSLVGAIGSGAGAWRLVLQRWAWHGGTWEMPAVNSAICSLGRLYHWHSAQSLLQYVACRRCIPDLVTYNTYIDGAGMDRRWHLSHEVFSKLKSGFLEADQVSFGAAMSAMDVAVKWREALGYAIHASIAGVFQSVVLLNACMSACVSAVLWRAALALSLRHGKAQERPNLGCFETILFGCKKAAAWSSTLALINSLQLSRLVPDGTARACGARACGSKSAWQASSAAFPPRMQPSKLLQISEDWDVWMAVIWSYETASQPCRPTQRLPLVRFDMRNTDTTAAVEKNRILHQACLHFVG
ncbi:unnamed protein product [Symbiodinium microadriaticum]|nr:unnamed protein product [Symbiodinium microadriaticum]CAE7932710.1 unnamed protein product [Symbiodinium sp. KB8]